MLIDIQTVLLLLGFHFVADFIFQDETWATNKSKKVAPLINHTFVYTLIFTTLVAIFIGLSSKQILVFYSITWVFHTLTDWITSKMVANKFEHKEYGSSIPNLGAFTYIGFDQVLHYIQIFLTYQYIQ